MARYEISGTTGLQDRNGNKIETGSKGITNFDKYTTEERSAVKAYLRAVRTQNDFTLRRAENQLDQLLNPQPLDEDALLMPTTPVYQRKVVKRRVSR